MFLRTCGMAFAVLVAILATGDAQAQTKKPDETAHGRWALLIGVDEYFEAQKLRFAGADMRTLRERLIAAGFPDKQVFLMDDQSKENKYRPLKANIERQLDLVLGLVERDDLLVLAFSGHGIHREGKSYFCPAEVRLGSTDTMISLDSVYDRMQKCPASLKLLLVDACRDDPRLEGQRSLTPVSDARELAQSLERPPEGILLLSSCAPGQISMEDKDFGHGIFMHYVLDGLGGAADADRNGRVSLMELFKYANRETKIYVARKFNGYQTPSLKGEMNDDFDISLLGSATVTQAPVAPTAIVPPASMAASTQAAPPSGPKNAANPFGPGRPFDGNLVGTVWSVTDSDGDRHYFQFDPEGILQYQSPRALSKAATWRMSGNSVAIDINGGYAVLEGLLSGSTMSGKGTSRNGQSWTWQATPAQ